MNRNPVPIPNGGISPEAERFIPAARSRTRGTSCVKSAVYRPSGKGYANLVAWFQHAQQIRSTLIWLTPNKVNRGVLGTRSAGEYLEPLKEQQKRPFGRKAAQIQRNSKDNE